MIGRKELARVGRLLFIYGLLSAPVRPFRQSSSSALGCPGVQAGAQEANSYVQPSVFDMLAGANPASAMDGWAE